nr:bromodomain-containing protein 8 [Ciona intestinalis]|eukprot:XP_009859365.1 bromodomain-containing protein 8 [Ciona intestinalis]
MNPDVEWSTREKLAIASYVLHSGDQHWSGGVSRMLRPLGEQNRPSDWFSSKNCAQQYSALVEQAETPRRKRGERTESGESTTSTSSSHGSSVSETIVRKLTQERIEELKKQIRVERSKYRKLKLTVDQITSGDLDDKLDEMLNTSTNKSDKSKDALMSPPSSVLSSPDASEEQSNVDVEAVTEDEQTVEKIQDSDQSTEQTVTLPTEEIPPTSQPVSIIEHNTEENPTPLLDTDEAMETEVSHQINEDSTNIQMPNTEIAQVELSAVDVKTQETSTSVNTPAIQSQEIPPLESSPTPTPVTEEILIEDSVKSDKTETPVAEETVKPEPTQTSVSPTIDTPPTITLSLNEDVNNSQLNSSTSSSYASQEPTSEDTNTHPTTDSGDSAKTSLLSNNKVSDTPKDKSQDVFVHPNEVKETSNIDTSQSQTNSIVTSQESNPSTTSMETKSLKDDEYTVDDDSTSYSASVGGDELNESSQLDDSNLSYLPGQPSTPYIDSFPTSPALSNTSDMDCEGGAHNRAWKKSIMILWKQVASHRYASLFLQPVTDDIAPNYSDIVYRAMDLSTLKKNLETGVVRTTTDFQRDLMLMFQNALMYNNREHDVYKMALEMQNDVMTQVAQFLATQLMMETAQPATPKGLRRSTLRKSVISNEKVSEARSKRTAAIEGELKFMKKKPTE